MIFMKYYLGGVIACPGDPSVIGCLMHNGFRQASGPADTEAVELRRGYGGAIEDKIINPDAAEIVAGLSEGFAIVKLVPTLPAEAAGPTKKEKSSAR
jgi:hypothetical protein